MKEDLSQHIQDCFIHLCASDDRFLGAVRQFVPPQFLGSTITEKMAQLCYSYYDQFKQAPKHHMHDELQRFLQTQPRDDKVLYVDYFKKIVNLQVSNPDYIIARMNEYIRVRKFEEALVECAELADQGRIEQAKNTIYDTLREDVSFDNPGTEILEQSLPSYQEELYDERDELFRTGIEHLDSVIKIQRGMFIVIFGPYGSGKSWFLIHLGKQALLRGLNVLHLTHEMRLSETEMRYDMSFSGSVKDQRPREVVFVEKILRQGQRGNTQLIDHRTETHVVDTVFNLSRVRKSRGVMKRFGGRLIIKKYPMGTCSIEEVERYLNHLEIFKNFIPDFLIQDYIDIMKLPGPNTEVTRNKLNTAYIHHKRLADERNITIVTASQVNRRAFSRGRPSKEDSAEDIRKGANTDLVLGMSTPERYKERNMSCIWVLKNRMGRDGVGCFVQNNYDIGAFNVASFPSSTSLDNDENEADE